MENSARNTGISICSAFLAFPSDNMIISSFMSCFISGYILKQVRPTGKTGLICRVSDSKISSVVRTFELQVAWMNMHMCHLSQIFDKFLSRGRDALSIFERKADRTVIRDFKRADLKLIRDAP